MRSALVAPIVVLFAACHSASIGTDPERRPQGGETEDSASDSAAPFKDTGPVEQVPGDSSQQDEHFLFTDEAIHAFEIELPSESVQALQYSPYEYAQGSFSYDGDTWEDVGVRLKGSSAYRSLSGKAAFKVKFNFIDEEQKFHDLRRLTLNNMVYDPSAMHEYLAYKLYRDAGLPAPRVGYATLIVNGQDYGLYAIVDTMDESFIEQWWENDEGSLYESGSFNYPCDVNMICTCFEIDEQGDESDWDDLLSFCEAVTIDEPDQQLVMMDLLLDMDMFLKTVALDTVLAHWDSYSGNLNNFHLYHEPSLEKWYWTPWSTDLSFGWNPWSTMNCANYMTSPNNYSQGFLAQTCKRNPDCKPRFLDAMAEMTDHLEAADLPSIIPEHFERIKDAVYADPRREYTDIAFENDVACITEWIQQRPENLRTWLEQQSE